KNSARCAQTHQAERWVTQGQLRNPFAATATTALEIVPMEVPTKGKGTGTRLATQPAPAPIRLKATLLRHGIRHDEVADRLIQAGGSRAGLPLSRSAFTLLLNRG